MKTLLSTIVICAWVFQGDAQTNLALTNNIQIGNANVGHDWMYFSIGNTNAMEINADYSANLIISQTSTNGLSFILVPMKGTWNISSFLHLSLMSPSGTAILPTEMGKTFAITPRKPSYELKTAISSEYEMPKISDLFNITNGEYILEARLWWWNRKDGLTLSDPVRIKVIARNIATTNALPQK